MELEDLQRNAKRALASKSLDPLARAHLEDLAQRSATALKP
jgi:hypothetical protein